MLKSIVPLFTRWVELTPGNSLDPGKWAHTCYLIEYVKKVTKTVSLEPIQFEAVGSEESYTWPWQTLQDLKKELDSLSGLVQISLDGYEGDELLVELTQDKVTVALVWGTPEIRCRELDRDDWTCCFMDLLTGRTPETYGKVLLLSDQSVEKMKGQVCFSRVSISPLK